MIPRLPFAALALVAASAFATEFPKTETKPVTDVYHGVSVVDPYRWLENWDDPAVKAWSEAQNAAARRMLDTLPHVAAIRTRVTEILSAQTVSYFDLQFAGEKYFVQKRQPPKQQPFLLLLDAPTATETARVLVDPNTLNPKGTTTIDWYVPSPDGKLVAVSLSDGGS